MKQYPSRYSRARVLAKRGLNQVYSTIPKSQKWWIINCAINVIWVILQGSALAKEKTCETTTSNFANHGYACMAMHEKTWITSYIFKKFPSFFTLKFIPSGIFQIIC
jgi:hypothetical protein